VFQLPDLIFNQMPLFIKMRVYLTLLSAIAARWNDNCEVSLFQFHDERLSVIAFVSDHLIGIEVCDERFSLRDVVPFAACQDEAQRVA
jgi:hypothetical protein